MKLDLKKITLLVGWLYIPFFGFVILKRVTIGWIVISLVLAVVSFIVSDLCKKDVPVEKTSLQDWKLILFPLLAWTVSTLIYIPIELYTTNPGDFQFGFWHYVFVLTIGLLIIVSFSFWTNILLLSKKQMKLLYSILFALVFMGYIQGIFLNKGLEKLTGDSQTWDIQVVAINNIIWLVVVLSIIIFSLKSDKMDKIIMGLSIYLSLVQMVAVVSLICTGNINKDAKYNAFTDKGALEITQGNNVIVLLLDRFDTEFFENALDNSQSIAEQLRDFTYYPNATCEFSRTADAIPYLLTGTDRPEDMSEGEYTEYAYTQSDALFQIQMEGYKIGLYTDEDLVPEEFRKVAENNNDDMKKQCGFLLTIFTMMKCSKYRMSPLYFKDYYYYTSEITYLIENKEIWSIDNDYPFYEKLMKKGLSVSEESETKGKFYFYHLLEHVDQQIFLLI